jgi:hypothetical protein
MACIFAAGCVSLFVPYTPIATGTPFDNTVQQRQVGCPLVWHPEREYMA